MNILHLNKELNYSCGITQIIRLTTKYSSKSFNHFILTSKNSTTGLFDHISGLYLCKIHIPIIEDILSIMKILHICQKKDIKIFHSYDRKFDLICSSVGFLLNIRTITSVQSKVEGYRYLSYKAENLIAVSNSIKTHLIKYFGKPESKIKIINNFINPEEWQYCVNTYKRIPNKNDDFRIGYCGRIDKKEKGVDILIESFNSLEIKNKKLILAGRIQELSLKSLINDNKNIQYLGELQNPSILYANIDLFILPSRVEPFGIVLLEAGIHKLPVIASATDGIKEIINHRINGLLFERENSSSLTSCIMEVYCDYEKHLRLAENLFNEVSLKFSSEQAILKIENIYRNGI